jgi:phage gp36-like protein
MPFLSDSDYKSQITDGILARVIEDDNTLVPTEEQVAIELISSYLSIRFDCDAIFAETGSSRNSLIIMHMVNIVLFNLFTRVVPKNIPEVRTIRYQATLEWLTNVAKGELSPSLPLKQVTDPETGEVVDENLYFLKSNKKYSEGW